MLPERKDNESLVTEIAEEASPLVIEHKEVLTSTPSHFSAQVYIDPNNKKPLIETPENKEVVIEIPSTQAKIISDKSGPVDESSTWRATNFFRQIQKAFLTGIKIVYKG